MPVFFTHSQPIILMKREITYYSHFHYEAELIYVVSGRYRVISKGVTYDLGEGDIWLGFPFDEHSYVDIGDNVTMLAIFAPEHLGAVGRLLCTRRPGRPVVNVSEFPPGFGDGLVRVAQMWMALNKRNESAVRSYENELLDSRYIGSVTTRETVLAYLSAAIGELLGAMNMSPRDSAGVYSIQKIVNCCADNISDPELSMNKLTAAVGLSRSQISRLMSSMMKTSFPEFLHALRIRQARQLLMFTDKTVTDIAFECGFMSQRNFNRVFREMTGMTPSEFRERSKELGNDALL